jgi:uncharacterized membrane protein
MEGMYLTIRVLHVLMGAVWVGWMLFLVLFLQPAVLDTGPEGAKVMAAVERRGFVVAIPIVAAVTILSGLWLYWRYTAGFSPEISRSHAGIAFGTGGALAIIAAIIGGAIVSRVAAKATALSKDAAALPEGAKRTATLAAALELRKRLLTLTKIIAVLLVATIALMSIAILI